MDDIDRILMSEEALTPSLTFGARVMEVIEVVAGEPASVPFPWGRFAAGLLACAAGTASGAWLVSLGGLSMLDAPLAELAAVKTELGYAAATVLVSLATVSVQRTLSRIAITGH